MVGLRMNSSRAQISVLAGLEMAGLRDRASVLISTKGNRSGHNPTNLFLAFPWLSNTLKRPTQLPFTRDVYLMDKIIRATTSGEGYLELQDSALFLFILLLNPNN